MSGEGVLIEIEESHTLSVGRREGKREIENVLGPAEYQQVILSGAEKIRSGVEGTSRSGDPDVTGSRSIGRATDQSRNSGSRATSSSQNGWNWNQPAMSEPWDLWPSMQ